jgi:formate hydrogenlyase transcriptional activator
VAATNGDQGKLISEKRFRSDLDYRLNVFPISVPPLRDRAEDIPLPVRHFVAKYVTRMQKVIERIRAEVMDFLTSYSWPGNIRELQNFIECSVILTPGSTLRCPLARLRSGAQINSAPEEPITLGDLNREHICRTLQQTRGVIMGPNGAAAQLGIKRTILYARMRKLGISRVQQNLLSRGRRHALHIFRNRHVTRFQRDYLTLDCRCGWYGQDDFGRNLPFLPTLIQLMSIRNGLGAPSCPA